MLNKRKKPYVLRCQPQKTNSSFKYDPQIKKHKSRLSEEQALICDGAAIHRGSSSGKEPQWQPAGICLFNNG